MVFISSERYFREFKVVEIQKTFYQLPKRRNHLREKRIAPLDFRIYHNFKKLIKKEER